jgi:hypothetical protein
MNLQKALIVVALCTASTLAMAEPQKGPVVEPPTYSMLLSGLLLAGLIMRRGP